MLGWFLPGTASHRPKLAVSNCFFGARLVRSTDPSGSPRTSPSVPSTRRFWREPLPVPSGPSGAAGAVGDAVNRRPVGVSRRTVGLSRRTVDLSRRTVGNFRRSIGPSVRRARRSKLSRRTLLRRVGCPSDHRSGGFGPSEQPSSDGLPTFQSASPPEDRYCELPAHSSTHGG